MTARDPAPGRCPASPLAEAGAERATAPVSRPVAAGVVPAALVSVAVAAAVFLLYFRAQPHWLADPDAQDYAQLGRQLAAGRGPVTAYLPWNGAAYLAGRGAGPGGWDASAAWPNIARFPLTPVLMAAAFGAFGPSDAAVHLPAGLAFVLGAGVAALVAGRVAGAWAAVAAGLVAATLPLLVNYSLTGLTEPLLGTLLLGVLACLVGRSPTDLPGARRLVAGGALLGLAVLNRYDTALLALPILLLWLARRGDRWRACGLFFGVAAVLVLPWAVYLWAVAGAPLFNLQPASIAAQASGRADGLGWYLPEYVRPTDLWSRDPARAARLGWEQLAETPNHLRKLIGWPWLIGGLVAVLLASTRAVIGRAGLDDAGVRLALFLVVAVLLRAGLASGLGLNLQRHFVPLVTLLVVVTAGEGVWWARTLLDRLPGRIGIMTGARRLALSAFVGLLAAPGLLVIWPFLVPPAVPPGPPTRTGEVEARPENLDRLAGLVRPSAVVASNVPWSVAWQADRRAVPLPPTVADLAGLERRFGLRIDAVYLAGQVAIADAPRSWRAWDDLRRRGEAPPGFVLAASTPNGGRIYLREP